MNKNYLSICISGIALLLYLLPSVVAVGEEQTDFNFSDVGKQKGFLPEGSNIQGHGAAWGDVNGDGWPDLYVATFHYKETKPNLLFLNRGGRFELDKQTETRLSTRATGVLLADFDNDGDNDLYVASMPAPTGSKLAERQGHAFAGCSLFRNDGKGAFTNVSKGSGACPPAFGGRSAAILDFDGDGLLDLLVGEDPIPGYNGSKTTSSRLFRNLGGLKFEDFSREAGIPEGIPGLGVAAQDVNLDSWPDVLIVSTKGSHLFLNDGKGKFKEAKCSPKTFHWPDAKGDDMICGATIGDINHDGLPDILLGQHFSRPWVKPVANRLYLNLGIENGEPTFEDQTEKVGLLALPMKSPHLEVQDFDNDGRMDVYASLVKFDSDGNPAPLIFKNMGNDKKSKLPSFKASALEVNDFPTAEDQSIKSAGKLFQKMIAEGKIIYSAPGPTCDFNKDGKMDMVMPCWWKERDSLLLQNETKGGNWIQVEIKGTDGVNAMGIGSRVTIYDARRAGKPKSLLSIKETASGFGYASGQEAVVHFGLGEKENCDVQITLPHGKGTITRANLSANQRMVISTNEELRDENLSNRPWPPELPGVKEHYASVQTDKFLEIPTEVRKAMSEEGYAEFEMAKVAPRVEISFHDRLGPQPAERRLWSSWGDICVARDGSVYSGIGDHGDDAGGDGRCLIYRWDPKKSKLTQVADMGKIVPPKAGQPAWTKVHARIDEGRDGGIYFSCTLNAGQRAGDPKYKWNERLPGGQLYRYDPKTKETKVFSNLPPKRCTATSLVDPDRNLWWCNLEGGEGDALYALDLESGKVVHQTKDGVVEFNRAIALGNDGSIYFNGKDGKFHRMDPKTGKTSFCGITFPGESPGIRSATRMSTNGIFYGSTHKTNQLYSISPKRKKIDLLGPTWGTGQYTTVMLLSADERFLYYLPGSHGQAWKYGTPVMQFDLKRKKRKVLAFLGPALEEQIGYVPGGTYGVKLSKDGSTLYVNFNGHPRDDIRPSNLRPIGFGLNAFAAIHVPESER
jgi:sugar lactone lactonase YvrE